MASWNLTPCKIGLHLNDECHKLTYCRRSGFVSCSELSQGDKDLLQWRSGVHLTSQDQICMHHEKLYLSRFETLQKYCSDPFSIHKKHVTSKCELLALKDCDNFVSLIILII